jgi:cell wall-associated NlpC family hydrolase
LGWCLLLQACSTTPLEQPSPPRDFILPPPGTLDTPLPALRPLAATASMGSEIVIRAISLLGAPYKFGGAGPAAFDCSGLVSFIHEEVGIPVPRTAAEQYRAATPVPIDELEPGDLLFFKTRGASISHVAIYAGSNRFVHAPKAGHTIELRMMDDGYYKQRLVGAGRLF